MIEAIIMGLVQGLTEFLPISSTAHLVILPWFFRWTGEVNTLTFDLALHAGTLLALLLCFRKDWVVILTKDRRMLLLLAMASVPAGLAGIILHDVVENSLRQPYVIGASLVIGGVAMLFSERMFKHKNFSDITASDALVIGLAQAVALVPGVSRSGITIAAGLFQGIEREASARFSFLLSTPVIGGAVLLQGRKVLHHDPGYDLQMFLVGFIASAVTGYVAIRFLISFFRRHPLDIFAWYRFGLAAVIITEWLRR